ncbi:MAG: CcmD family protein [Bacteroidetes bacterium]|nr:CcmD family protein [Bacteroidota bacterium]
MKKSGFFLSAMFLCIIAKAQDKPEMADVMRSNGKIYVVVAVCLLILFGLFIYLFILDRKISNLEKNNNQ